MKGLFAIFFSVALIVSQAAFINGGGDFKDLKASTPKCCGQSGCCEGGPCCAAKNSSGSEKQAPAAPSRGVSRIDYQLSVATVVQLLAEKAAEPVALPSSFSVCSSFAALLYQRNCSYLI